jgi:hypothetical protein
MFREGLREREMQDSRFIAVQRPGRAEGIGRALQIAYRNAQDLPGELCSYIQRLDRVAY